MHLRNKNLRSYISIPWKSVYAAQQSNLVMNIK